MSIICSTQYGKKLADSTPIFTTQGWKNHGDLQVGDYVFSPSGKPIKVEAIANDSVDIDYEIEFSNGENIACHGKHEWYLSHRGWKGSAKPYRVIETEEILSYKNLKDFVLPNIQPLKFEENELPLDPYFLGAWLGDGTTGEPVITNDREDKAITEKIPYKVSSIYVHKTTGVHTIRFYGNGISPFLKKIGTKHIPLEYKTSSVRQRLELLAGLIDSDGSVNKELRENGWKNGRVYISNTNKTLVNDICDLVHGLGMRTSVTKILPTTSSSGIVGKKDVYCIGFQPTLDIPTVLSRKKITPIKNKRRITIRSIKKIQPVRGKCIQVEGGLYLAGKTMLPTHNSMVTAWACLILTCVMGLRVAIVAPSDRKAKIIMRYVIKHLGDSEVFEGELDQNSRLERLQQEQSKTAITFKNGASIFIVSVNQTNSQKGIESAMGEGAEVVILDEACLVEDDNESTVYRMIAGKGANAFYCKIGNPFYSESPNAHFRLDWEKDNFLKILIDYKQGMREGRYTEEFIKDAKSKPLFDILYECKFPEMGIVDEKGFMQLMTSEAIVRSFDRYEVLVEKGLLKDFKPKGNPRLGVDVGRGGDASVFVLRYDNYAEVLNKNTSRDLMTQVRFIEQYVEKYGINPCDVFVDDTGMGGGLTDRCHEIDLAVTGVRVGSSPLDDERFVYLRDEIHWLAKNWFEEDNPMVKPHEGFYDLSKVKYEQATGTRKIKMEQKELLKKRIKRSPDVSDALTLTFCLGEPDPEIYIV